MVSSKGYTAQAMRQRANEEEHLWHDRLTAAMLRQAAEMCERADAVIAKAKKVNEAQMSFGCHSCVENYIKEINYILCGDAGRMRDEVV